MGVNRFLPHVLVLPEDDRNRQLANGFRLDPGVLAPKIQVLPPAGGWGEVLTRFKSDHVGDMDAHPLGFMVLLIDFDNKEDRLGKVKAEIPGRLKDRVFVLGVWSEPEKLNAALGRPGYESIGLAMARDCREGTETTWSHDLLRHNAAQFARLRQYVRPILFQPV